MLAHTGRAARTDSSGGERAAFGTIRPWPSLNTRTVATYVQQRFVSEHPAWNVERRSPPPDFKVIPGSGTREPLSGWRRIGRHGGAALPRVGGRCCRTNWLAQRTLASSNRSTGLSASIRRGPGVSTRVCAAGATRACAAGATGAGASGSTAATTSSPTAATLSEADRETTEQEQACRNSETQPSSSHDKFLFSSN